jgi:diaminopropionate ammonia-lyase
LIDLPALAARLEIAQILVKDESRRMLGSFKSLGGTYAGLRALARAAKICVEELVATRPSNQPVLICASDGNHGLAVAAAARFAGARARVYLHGGVPQARARRIEEQGAEVVWVQGTYDDAVDAAAAAARAGQGILVADTTDDPNDPVVRDVVAGYGVLADEIKQQVESGGHQRPTHHFVQAGVGGLAAAMAEGLGKWLAEPGPVVIVEPESCPAVAVGLAKGRPERVEGSLETTAEMLSCGEASAPALKVLKRHRVEAVTVSEEILDEAPGLLVSCGGPRSTSSGCAGLAGLMAVQRGPKRLSPQTRVLLVITEAEVVPAPEAPAASPANRC